MINELAINKYPGRGIIIGETPDGENAVIAYFIMGRSVNSRNRVFVEKDGGIITKAYDESKMVDPSLIIYAPVRVLGDKTIVTNGDQTDTIYDFMKNGKTFADGLRTREYEPDEPNFTPRISGVVDLENGFSYKLSILKYNNGNCQRNFYEYEDGVAGKGHLIHTYKTDGNPIPTFEGEPREIELDNDFEQFTNDLWTSLDNENRVSLFVRYINLKDKSEKTKIINANQ
ncbi:MAG: IMP cyclohydrolase [Clostridia bacterium]|nr:IMP cyclohydrolase [Clostridia bacterium]